MPSDSSNFEFAPDEVVGGNAQGRAAFCIHVDSMPMEINYARNYYEVHISVPSTYLLPSDYA